MVFFKASCHANPGEVKKNKRDQVHKFQDTYFESFHIDRLTTIYLFEHINQ